MDLGLTDRTAFVAGASSGLGLATALSLAHEGCRVAICSRSPARIEAAADRIARSVGPDRVHPIACDVTDESQIESAIASTIGKFGSLHVLVTNAGGPPAGRIDDFGAAEWESALQLNLLSTINLVRHALPHLREAAEQDEHARVIMIASISAKQPIPTLYLSNVSRAGVLGFAKSLAEEEGARGMTVNCVLPGYTRTDRLAELSEALSARSGASVDDIEAGWAASSALLRIGTETEFADTVTFLAGRPAGYITGVALPIDGGAVKHLL
jgi:3-oxoacyl-[acyl-carrier protein] reductase